MTQSQFHTTTPQSTATVFEAGTVFDRAFSIVGLLNGSTGTQIMAFKMSSRKGSDTVEIKIGAEISLKPILGHLERREISVKIDDDSTIITVV